MKPCLLPWVILLDAAFASVDFPIFDPVGNDTDTWSTSNYYKELALPCQSVFLELTRGTDLNLKTDISNVIMGQPVTVCSPVNARALHLFHWVPVLHLTSHPSHFPIIPLFAPLATAGLRQPRLKL